MAKFRLSKMACTVVVICATTAIPSHGQTLTQTITFTQAAPAFAPYSGRFTVAATASSGLPVSFSSSGVCTNVGATFTMTNSTGRCSVIANQSGNGVYLLAPTIEETTTATKASQVVSFTGVPSSAEYQSSFTVSTTSNAGTVPTITASGSCSISRTTVTMTSGTGSCTLTAKWPANTHFFAASLGRSTTAQKLASAINWPTPAAITYPTPLSATQLDATANVAGTFIYVPASGTVLNAGTQKLIVTFTPSQSANYKKATVSVPLQVDQAVPTITWPTPAAITYGQLLSATQLNATANVTGKFIYSPAAGTQLNAGSETLNVTFTPFKENYATVTTSVTLQVNQATSIVTWLTPAAITYGTPLRATQLDATANTAGTFAYSPPLGTVLSAGSRTLKVSFTPARSNDYTPATASVVLQVVTGAQEGILALVQAPPHSACAVPALNCAVELDRPTSAGDLYVFAIQSGTSFGRQTGDPISISEGGSLIEAASCVGPYFNHLAYVLPANSTSVNGPITVNFSTPTAAYIKFYEFSPSNNGDAVDLDNCNSLVNGVGTSISGPGFTFSAANDAAVQMLLDDGVTATGVSSPYNGSEELAANDSWAASTDPVAGLGAIWTQPTAAAWTMAAAFGWYPALSLNQGFNDFECGGVGNHPAATDLTACMHGWQGLSWDTSGVVLMHYTHEASMPLLNPTGRLYGDGNSYAPGRGSQGLSIRSDGTTETDKIVGFFSNQQSTLSSSDQPLITVAIKYNDNLPATDPSFIDCFAVHGHIDYAATNCDGAEGTRYFRLETGEGAGAHINVNIANSCPCSLVLQYNTGVGNITNFSITNNVVTFTAANRFKAGELVTIAGLETGTYLNGQVLTVLPVGLSSTEFEAKFTNANIASTPDSGTAAGTHQLTVYDKNNNLLGTSRHVGRTALDYPFFLTIGQNHFAPITAGRTVSWDSLQISTDSTIPNR